MSPQPKTDHGTSQSRRRAKYLAGQDRKLLESLVEIRRTSGLSQEDVAELLGVSQQAVSKFEGMDSSPSLARIRHYAHAVGALVAHVVKEDSGQLESHGDKWVEFSFAMNDRQSSKSKVSNAAIIWTTSSAARSAQVFVGSTQHAFYPRNPLPGSAKSFSDVTHASEEPSRTDFALGA